MKHEFTQEEFYALERGVIDGTVSFADAVLRLEAAGESRRMELGFLAECWGGDVIRQDSKIGRCFFHLAP